MSASGDVTILPSSCLSAPWPPTRPPAPTPTRPREWTWPTASPTCGSKPRSTAWTRCPRSTERRGRGWGREGRRSAVGPLQTGHRLWDQNHLITPTEPRSLLHPYAKMLDSEWCRIFPPSHLFFFFIIIIFIFNSSWASLNSCLYKKKTSLLDAVAEYLRSFTCVIVTEAEAEFFIFVFSISELVLHGDAWTDYVDSSSLQLWDKITLQVWDFSFLFFFFFESTTNRHRLLTFIHFCFLKKS